MRFVLRNLVGNYAVYAASIVSGIVLTPVIVHAIGKDGYGVWVFIGSLTVFLRTLDLGLAPSIVRYSAYYRGRGDDRAISGVASAALGLYAAISSILAVVAIVMAFVLPSLVSMHGAIVHAARIAALVTILALAVELPLGLLSSVLKGQQRFDVVNAGALVSLAVYATLVAAVLTSHPSVAVLAAIAALATAIRVLLPAALVRRELPSLRLSLRLASRPRVRELLSFSVWASAGQIAGKIIFSADAILIGLVLGSVPVAAYGVAMRLFTVAAGLSSTGTDLLFPAYSMLEGRGDTAAQQSYVETALRAATCVVVLVTAPLIFLPHWVVRAWLGNGFDGSATPLVLLALTLYFSQSTSVMGQFLLGRGRPRPLALIQTVFGAVNVIATVTLLVVVREIWVAALATLVLEAIVAVVVLPRAVARERIAYATLARAWSRPVVAGGVASAAVLLPAALLWRDSRSLPGVLAVGAVWTVVYAATAWRFALGSRERAFVRRTLTSARRVAVDAAEPA